AILPVLLRQRLTDDHDRRTRSGVALVERAAADDRNLERVEVPGDGVMNAATSREPAFVRASDDIERQPVAALQRYAARHRRRLDAGYLTDALEREPRRLSDGLGLLVERSRERGVHDEHILGRVAGIDGAKRERGADQQRGADEQHDGEADLDEDERRARFVLAETASRSAARVLDDGVQVGARGDERWDQSENNTGRDRQRDREQYDAPIHAEQRAGVPEPRQVGGAHRQQRTHAGVAGQESERATRERQHQALG